MSEAPQLDPLRLDRFTKGLGAEPGVSGVWVSNLDWDCSLDESVLQFRSAATVERYLAEQAWVLWPDGLVSSSMIRAVHHPELGFAQSGSPTKPLKRSPPFDRSGAVQALWSSQ